MHLTKRVRDGTYKSKISERMTKVVILCAKRLVQILIVRQSVITSVSSLSTCYKTD